MGLKCFFGKDIAIEYIEKNGGDVTKAAEQIARDRNYEESIVPGIKSEAMRNAEHYLFSAMMVKENRFNYYTMYLATFGYNAVKFWGGILFDYNSNSIPTHDELIAGLSGADDVWFVRDDKNCDCQ